MVFAADSTDRCNSLNHSKRRKSTHSGIASGGGRQIEAHCFKRLEPVVTSECDPLVHGSVPVVSKRHFGTSMPFGPGGPS